MFCQIGRHWFKWCHASSLLSTTTLRNIPPPPARRPITNTTGNVANAIYMPQVSSPPPPLVFADNHEHFRCSNDAPATASREQAGSPGESHTRPHYVLPSADDPTHPLQPISSAMSPPKSARTAPNPAAFVPARANSVHLAQTRVQPQPQCHIIALFRMKAAVPRHHQNPPPPSFVPM